jgi:glycerate 2-kinase
VKVLIAPDKFRDALDVVGVSTALATGVREALPHAEIVTCPVADGGEGTGRILADALGAAEHATAVLDPLGRPRSARWWLCPDGRTAIVEMAEASGLALLTPPERDPLQTTSYGTGQLLQAALDAGADRILLCVGGSATVDGGAGCLQALGWGFSDPDGAAIKAPITGGMLCRIGHVQPPLLRPSSVAVDILCDVDNPLLGPRGAAPVFGPQKGASESGVQELERGLAHWADFLQRCCATDLRALPSGGAAGGITAGLAAALHARLLPGFDEVARCVHLREKITGCAICLTGEGRLDEQTAAGKVVAGVARLAAEHNVPTLAFVGAVRHGSLRRTEELAHSLGLSQIVVITPPNTPLDEALAATRANLQRVAREVLPRWLPAK